ncbi:MAG: response regulator transcription factor, partial [Anaerolineae bacterium]|nr:response regulator transcription factor [Anaerolineae bacterium]
MKAHILIVDDDPLMCRSLAFHLEDSGYTTATASTIQDAFVQVKEKQPDLILMDVSLPDMSGMDALRLLRRDSQMIPTIFVTARSRHLDEILGLELGADDYVTKPFSPREVTARVRVVLRRSRGQVQPPPILRADTLVLDLEAHTATKDDQLLDLTPTEFEILAAFMRHPGQAFTRLQLVEAAQGVAYEGYERVMD